MFEYGSPAVPRIMKAAGWDYILKQFIREANTEILLIMQVETQKGMEHLDSIRDGRNWMRRGARFMTYGADFSMVQERSKMVLDALRPERRTHARRP
ncbi:MAG: hypothetical protein A3G35_02790 [candidate division NC10 bacterium RIFCSPLOWO2_12_FULL_66_18]|nr:MAG: hypothetical protein A3H39_14290 [candidate division NC10 bacterium RIFCSPLOWO2_02_FULL_66_22]OGB98407.1 MAG: hypothetical protein A3G35_02790 [candidate division NC10 bacterium RIFCSPLOWO2_12_FULL_66_18]